MKLMRSWVDRVVWLLTFVFFVYMFLMCVGCSATKYGAPPCMYGWLLGTTEHSSFLYVSKSNTLPDHEMDQSIE